MKRLKSRSLITRRTQRENHNTTNPDITLPEGSPPRTETVLEASTAFQEQVAAPSLCLATANAPPSAPIIDDLIFHVEALDSRETAADDYYTLHSLPPGSTTSERPAIDKDCVESLLSVGPDESASQVAAALLTSAVSHVGADVPRALSDVSQATTSSITARKAVHNGRASRGYTAILNQYGYPGDVIIYERIKDLMMVWAITQNPYPTMADTKAALRELPEFKGKDVSSGMITAVCA